MYMVITSEKQTNKLTRFFQENITAANKIKSEVYVWKDFNYFKNFRKKLLRFFIEPKYLG